MNMDREKLKAKFHSSEELMERYVGAAGSEARADMEARAAAWFYGEILRDRRKELKGEVDLQLSSLIRIAGALGLNLQLQ